MQKGIRVEMLMSAPPLPSEYEKRTRETWVFVKTRAHV